MSIRRFEDIEGWQLARELTKRVYAVAMHRAFAKDFGLRDQITRASGSAMYNIAEGFDGGSKAEFVKFLRYSQRSCSEVQSQLYIALDQAYIFAGSVRLPLPTSRPDPCQSRRIHPLSLEYLSPR